jgi:hypothetical protein
MKPFKFLIGNIPFMGEEPMRQIRYYVIFPVEFGIEPFYSRSINKPTFNPINRRWEEITLDIISPIEIRSIENILSLSVMNLRFNIKIYLLNPTGDFFSNWNITLNSFTTEFNEPNYRITIKPEICTINY